MTGAERVAALVLWIARIWSVASIAFVLMFLIGSISEEEPLPSGSELVGFFFFPICVLAGLVLAWWREGLGGAVTIGGLVGFYAWHVAASGSLPTGPWFVLIAAPGFLFLAASALSGSKSAGSAQP